MIHGWICLSDQGRAEMRDPSARPSNVSTNDLLEWIYHVKDKMKNEKLTMEYNSDQQNHEFITN